MAIHINKQTPRELATASLIPEVEGPCYAFQFQGKGRVKGKQANRSRVRALGYKNVNYVMEGVAKSVVISGQALEYILRSLKLINAYHSKGTEYNYSAMRQNPGKFRMSTEGLLNYKFAGFG